MAQVIKVFTPIKRVPVVVGKAQNGQKLPFGPYTLPQVGAGVVVMAVTGTFAMSLPVNPAVTFFAGTAVAILAVFLFGLIPYTGVRLTSRALWFARLIFIRKPVSASGMPVTEESSRNTVFVSETVVVVFPDRPTHERRPQPALPAGGWLRELVDGNRRIVSGNGAEAV
ncbi:hypothetical protein FEK35_10990 [Nocardia cyriacigeorgica]|uniref:Uncharacterized protein n=1 Tax=Nocardia cyriacigeorgica TaxID=135487 RepID=A0A5R8PFX7_9NOCA|nr:hypothetical protein [Nocardia cyriacigeorgica]TLG12433.1 hypothetical protein FEK35_10990 [Nocardia cyriacigeorgica]